MSSLALPAETQLHRYTAPPLPSLTHSPVCVSAGWNETVTKTPTATPPPTAASTSFYFLMCVLLSAGSVCLALMLFLMVLLVRKYVYDKPGEKQNNSFQISKTFKKCLKVCFLKSVIIVYSLLHFSL